MTTRTEFEGLSGDELEARYWQTIRELSDWPGSYSLRQKAEALMQERLRRGLS